MARGSLTLGHNNAHADARIRAREMPPLLPAVALQPHANRQLARRVRRRLHGDRHAAVADRGRRRALHRPRARDAHARRRRQDRLAPAVRRLA